MKEYDRRESRMLKHLNHTQLQPHANGIQSNQKDLPAGEANKPQRGAPFVDPGLAGTILHIEKGTDVWTFGRLDVLTLGRVDVWTC